MSSLSMSSSPDSQVTFVNEIMQMMHAFGDGLRSNPDTAYLIEEMVHKQMTSLFVSMVEVAVMRQAADQITLEDVLFALRKDKIKLARLYNHLHLKDSIESMNTHLGQPSSKRVKICRNFLSVIDETGDFETILSDELQDEIKRARKVRQEELSRTLSDSEYDKFCDCRRVSFSPPKKFELWLLNGDYVNGLELSNFRIHQFALEALTFLAYEAVGQIVDMCLLVRQGIKSEPGNPVPALASMKQRPTKSNHVSMQTQHQFANLMLRQDEPATISPEDVIEVGRRAEWHENPLGVNLLYTFQ